MCQYCKKRQVVENGCCHICLFLYSEEEIKVHQAIVDNLLTNVPMSVCMSVDELTDFVVRCLPYTNTYKIQNEDALLHIARHVIERTLPLVEYVIDVA